jgi:hypothetical protein
MSSPVDYEVKSSPFTQIPTGKSSATKDGRSYTRQSSDDFSFMGTLLTYALIGFIVYACSSLFGRAEKMKEEPVKEKPKADSEELPTTTKVEKEEEPKKNSHQALANKIAEALKEKKGFPTKVKIEVIDEEPVSPLLAKPKAKVASARSRPTTLAFNPNL